MLLAAGRSTRFGALKQVAPLGPGGASILVYTVLDALLAGFDEVVLVVRTEIEAAVVGHVRTHLGTRTPLRTVHQEEPLGTAHATLLALDGLDGAAAIANGDDAYGRDALRALRAACTTVADAPRPPVHAALVGYPMAGTLSDHGGVSRGAIETDDDDRVVSIREILGVRRDPGDPDRLIGRTMRDEPVTLPADAPASMNLWALGPGLGGLLRARFEEWHSGPRETEFVLTDEIEALRRRGEVEVRLAARGDGWFGVTFPEDAGSVRDRFEALHDEGVYRLPLERMFECS